ncbi:hemagglutinin repeat-containing protein [Erwinia aphidicola]|uniref:hemagglutinin repeat-containing protein n=1 Tax=Erwinia aphidicola TaxID=68334 RepID=UPI0030CD9D9E
MALNGVGLRAGKGILLSAGQSISLSPRTISQQNRLLDKWLTVENHAKYFPSWRAPELRASLNSGADLQIHAAADITAQGAQLTSVGTTTLYAGRDLLLGAQAYSFIDASNDNNKDERQLVADIQAGKNLTLAANGSLITQGSSVSAGGDLTATAGGNMRFESVANRIYRELSNGYSETLSQQGTALTSGGVLTLIGSGSILFQATRLLAQRSLDVAAQGGISMPRRWKRAAAMRKKPPNASGGARKRPSGKPAVR